MHDVKTTVYEQESNIIFMTRYNTMPLYRQLGVGYKLMVSSYQSHDHEPGMHQARAQLDMTTESVSGNIAFNS